MLVKDKFAKEAEGFGSKNISDIPKLVLGKVIILFVYKTEKQEKPALGGPVPFVCVIIYFQVFELFHPIL